jgi:hypothetical protein
VHSVTSRVGNVLLLVAGMPGIVALLLPIGESLPVVPVEHYRDQLQDFLKHLGFHLKHWPPVLADLWGLDWMVALPVPILLLQVRRLLIDRDMTRMSALTLLVITALLQLAAVAFALRVLTEITWSMPRGWLEPGPKALYFVVPMLALVAANAWLLYRNWRRGGPLVSTTEVFMMGAYLVAQAFWLLGGLLAEPVVAPKLMLWTCLVYAVTIAFRLRRPRVTGSARSLPNDGRPPPLKPRNPGPALRWTCRHERPWPLARGLFAHGRDSAL